MNIWHDDLGMQEDPHEVKVMLQADCFGVAVLVRVNGGDTAVASGGDSVYGYFTFANWYETIRLLMLAGF